MSIIKLKHIAYLLIFFVGVFTFSACEEDDDLNPVVNVIYSSNAALSNNTGYPGSGVIAEGEDMSNIVSIVFDDKVDVVFNPVLNSDVAIKFNVPFDEGKGSRFGKQLITFTNKDGQKFQSEFEILQPNPTLASKGTFDPERPTVGTSVVVNGEWFFDVKSVTFGGVPVEFTEISSTQLSFMVPEDASEGADVVIETVVGESDPTYMDIYLGFDVYLITNFDGEGFRPDNNWTSYGSFDTFDYLTEDGIDGTYALLKWAGVEDPNYNGAQSATGNTMIEETNPDKVKFVMDYNGDGYLGSIVDIYIVDGEVNWAYTFTIEQEGWQTLEALVSDFGKDYNMANQSNGDADPSKINQIKVALNQQGGTPNPSQVKFDNLKWYVYKEAQEGINGPKNLLTNGDFENGTLDGWNGWGNSSTRDISAEGEGYGDSGYAMVLTNPTATNIWEAQQVYTFDTPLELDVEYTCSFWVKASTDASLQVQFQSEDYSADYISGINVGTSWTYIEETVTITTDNRIKFIFDFGASAATYYIDDIKVIKK